VPTSGKSRRLRTLLAIYEVDLSLTRIEAAVDEIDPVFLGTPQFVSDRISSELGREVVVKVETLNPIGSFKGRGTSVLGRNLNPRLTWVSETAGNFGQGLAYEARKRGAAVHLFVPPDAPGGKVARMRALGAEVEARERPAVAAREHADASEDRVLVVDGLDPATAEGAGTIGLELEAVGPIDTAVIQLGDGALISGVARWLKSRSSGTRIVGVCASGAPAMARSFAAGRRISDPGEGTIATSIAITEPVPESLERILALVDEVVLVGDDDMRSAMGLIADSMGVLVEPAGAAGVAALSRHPGKVTGDRVAVLLTGAAT
jgi:threonine dehydratase